MAVSIEKWETKTFGDTVGEMTAYAGGGSFSIVFREDGHKKVTYQFHNFSDLSDAIIILKKGWLSRSGGK